LLKNKPIAVPWMAQPTSGLPVKLILITPGCVVSGSGLLAEAGHHVDHACRRPASSSRSARYSVDSRASLAGLTTIELPGASAGAIFQPASISGEFQG
jgi:hypothetical protein